MLARRTLRRELSAVSSSRHSRAAATEPLWTLDFVKVLVAGSAFGFAFSSFILLPKFMVTVLGAGPADIGIVAGVFGLAAVGVSPLVGLWIDRIPRRRFMGAGALVMAVASVGFIAVDEVGAYLYALRLVQGVAFTLVLAAVPTLVSEIVPASRLSEAVGLSGASMLVMNAIAPAIAEPLAAAVGWRPTFVLAAAGAAASCLLVTTVRENHRGDGHDASSATLLDLLGRRDSQALALVVGLSAVAFGAMFQFLQPFAMELGRTEVGGFFVAYALAATTVRVGFGWLPDRLGLRRVAIGALCLYASVVLSVTGLRPELLEVTGLIFGLAHGALFPALTALALSRARPSERGRTMTIVITAFNIGAWGGSAALGMTAEALGYPVAFAVAGITAATAAVMLAASRCLAPVAPSIGAWPGQ